MEKLVHFRGSVIDVERRHLRRQARVQMFDAMVRVMREASRIRPLIIVFEDLHWAGSTAVALLRFMPSRLEGERVLLLCTYRSSGTTRMQDFRVALGELGALRRSQRVALEGL